jgi:hypothetical protein
LFISPIHRWVRAFNEDGADSARPVKYPGVRSESYTHPRWLRPSPQAARLGDKPEPRGTLHVAGTKGLQPRLAALHARLRAGHYCTQPARKDDGSERLLGVWSVEDKRVQGAAIEC